MGALKCIPSISPIFSEEKPQLAIELYREFVTIANSTMKLILSTSALAAYLGIALASVPATLSAQTPTATDVTTAGAAATTPAPTKKSKPTEYEGTLTAIDTTANIVSVASTAKLLTMSITPATKIKKDKKPATLADFAIGDKVTGSYTKDATGTLTAYSLHKSKPKATPKPTTTAAALATPADTCRRPGSGCSRHRSIALFSHKNENAAARESGGFFLDGLTSQRAFACSSWSRTLFPA